MLYAGEGGGGVGGGGGGVGGGAGKRVLNKRCFLTIFVVATED